MKATTEEKTRKLTRKQIQAAVAVQKQMEAESIKAKMESLAYLGTKGARNMYYNLELMQERLKEIMRTGADSLLLFNLAEWNVTLYKQSPTMDDLEELAKQAAEVFLPAGVTWNWKKRLKERLSADPARRSILELLPEL